MQPDPRDLKPPFDAGLAFKALGDPTRFAMACLLAREERSPSEIAALLAVSRPTVSHHSVFFKEAGLLVEKLDQGRTTWGLRMDRMDSLSAVARAQLLGNPQASDAGISIGRFRAPVGTLEIEASPTGLVRIERVKEAGARATGERREAGISPQASKHVEAAFDWFEEYFRGKRPSVDSKLQFDWPQDGFPKRVWQALIRIPYGETRFYGGLAKQLGKPKGARVIGSIVGKNPFGVLVPCHRVVGSDSSLTGYAWGLPMKEWLLKHEGWEIRGKRLIEKVGNNAG